MNTITIEGQLRTGFGKAATRQLRSQEMVPGVIYGGAQEINFAAPAAAFKKLVYTPSFQFCEVKLEGKTYRTILKDLQFDKVNDDLIHVDLLELVEDKKVVATIPLKFVGTSKGVKDGHLIKWIGGEDVDGSLAALISPLGLIDPSSELAIKTVSEIKNQLGLLGTRRHVNDVYFGGGRWLILSCFLALSLIQIGEYESAQEVITWLESQADSDLELPEQVGDDLLFPEAKKEWVAKWGEPAKPLLWSHAMYLMLNSELNKVLN